MALPVLPPALKTLVSKLTNLAASLFGDPLNAEQAEAFIFLLFVIGIGLSVVMVAAAYVYFWIADLRKKNKAKVAKPVLQEQKFF